MASRIILNAFEMTCVSHQAAGTWRHPDSQAWKYKDLDYWIDLAKLLERGYFDSVFIADVVGVYDIYRGSVETSLLDADQVPVNDPFFQVPAMAAVTKHLGFGVTSALTYEQPYALARKFSTLDHLTKGRVAWNVVTSYLNSAAVNLGLKQQISHDERYDIADEFLDVTYKLWEGSWDEDAVLRDRERGIFTDPSKVHPIGHKGKYYDVPGIHLSEPSPQRTPVIFQAGASSRGRAFAAKHAEGVFISPATAEQAREVSDDIRNRAVAAGRSRDSVKVFTLLTVITGESDEAAQAKYRDYLSYANGEGMLSFYGGWTGIDFSEYDPDQPLEAIDNDSIRSVLELLATADPDRKWTPRDIIKHRSIGGLGPVLVGGPKTVADEMERWVDVGGIDGFNLAYAITPGTFEDLVEFIVPELQRRGRVRTAYEGDTLRENLLDGTSSYAADDHPAARYRGAFKTGANATDHTKPSKFSDLT
ncbi:LLM class flavin-dependent oxidoreductase [Pseudomonas extremaustralis]|jgi:long-chain alkane monooxygenase|uniref:Dimethylsulfide monooxygenase, large subunit n=1 Tax=Pseudomonas extremaustralis TaxID=359110 RepID=A0A5C5Q5W1_9PSED|nr:LLM class flavin-dependent oxidoreductase [Pseudomonas extremaustralis]EZI25814.1 5,10-methylene tetrahydromethanopterin reductase [Pseudomonas extremaustralis 14-3 substr. 14-3b]MDB1111561.1 LLM class flavin-dependent oxidoreductase [Pseudomonas extremaustralis]MDF3135549.1 LLM class flavin-dependent oxidoreductase [Pseudomonas extremaustralis]MDG2970378.1 LLM class flavin-dependent oxidoreductase [Pseudomonas extremaustralis]MDY7064273.1 Dimethyl-sulfide monooxygenase [Pseudomonas extrema